MSAIVDAGLPIVAMRLRGERVLTPTNGDAVSLGAEEAAAG